MSIYVLPRASKKQLLPKDGKTAIGYAFWNMVNKLIVAFHFEKVEVRGMENIPASGPFLLIANHSSRWDGPLVQRILNRRANYMVSPNEMRGLQGSAVMSVGAFPANPRLNPVAYALQQLKSGEPVVVFPEGNVFYDGELHKFKPGVAKIALTAASNGFGVPIVPVHITYFFDGTYAAKVTIGKAILPEELIAEDGSDREVQHSLSMRMFEEVLKLRDGRLRIAESTSLKCEEDNLKFSA